MRNKVKILNWRFFLICACISFSVLAVIYKVFSIQIKESNFLQNEGNKRYVKYKNISPVRGSIFDKNNPVGPAPTIKTSVNKFFIIN